ncbi:hypothetical protein TREES_T100004008 [Tupaia chinensis]|uniref:Uncharacterized protein n=1 Tax=Tupaia chinensis TaxID=246437 RepID=L9KMW8_TUPCH|nr:hypothetical protein TREES_T100004008 [Tupaia chinensis]
MNRSSPFQERADKCPRPLHSHVYPLKVVQPLGEPGSYSSGHSTTLTTGRVEFPHSSSHFSCPAALIEESSHTSLRLLSHIAFPYGLSVEQVCHGLCGTLLNSSQDECISNAFLKGQNWGSGTQKTVNIQEAFHENFLNASCEIGDAPQTTLTCFLLIQITLSDLAVHPRSVTQQSPELGLFLIPGLRRWSHSRC